MSNSNKTLDNEASDSDVRDLLTLAGPRIEPPEEMRARVYSVVHDVWENEILAPAPSAGPLQASANQYRYPKIAASIGALGFAIWLSLLLFSTPDANRVGRVTFASGAHSLLGNPSADSKQLFHGSMVQTQQDGRLFITLLEGKQLRIDINTSLTIQNESELWLHEGRIYVDSASDNSPLKIITPVAEVSDIGTQFSVDLLDRDLVVAVREGQVNISIDNQNLAMSVKDGVGEKITINSGRDIQRTYIHSTDEEWQWIYQAAKVYRLEQGSLFDFLSWASRESGFTLKFSSNAVKLSAKQTLVHGDISGLTPDEAIPAVLATTKLHSIAEEGSHEFIVDYRR